MNWLGLTAGIGLEIELLGWLRLMVEGCSTDHCFEVVAEVTGLRELAELRG